jgi:hypothetical protein
MSETACASASAALRLNLTTPLCRSLFIPAKSTPISVSISESILGSHLLATISQTEFIAHTERRVVFRAKVVPWVKRGGISQRYISLWLCSIESSSFRSFNKRVKSFKIRKLKIKLLGSVLLRRKCAQMFALCGIPTRDLLRRRVFPPLGQIDHQNQNKKVK